MPIQIDYTLIAIEMLEDSASQGSAYADELLAAAEDRLREFIERLNICHRQRPASRLRSPAPPSPEVSDNLGGR